jgi:hypothetical protein
MNRNIFLLLLFAVFVFCNGLISYNNQQAERIRENIVQRQTVYDFGPEFDDRPSVVFSDLFKESAAADLTAQLAQQ